MSETKPASKRAARERLAEQRAQQQAADRRRDRLIRGGLVAVVFLVVAAVGLGVYLSTQKTDTTAAVPAGVEGPAGGIAVGTVSKPVLDLWEDYQCPACKAFEDNVGPTIEQLEKAGKVKVVYHPVSFLDANLNNDSSKRAANAAGCAQDQGKYVAFHDQVYAHQPTQEGTGYTDAQLIQFGKDAGVPDMQTFTQCVQNGTYFGWSDNVTASMTANQVTGTPTIIVAGKKVDLSGAASFADVKKLVTDAVTSAAGS